MTQLKLHALRVRVRGVVQGVGFRPFVFRLAQAHRLNGWVLNAEDGIDIHVQGAEAALDEFVSGLRRHAPQAAQIGAIEISQAAVAKFDEFSIRQSRRASRLTAPASPDLATCEECAAELFDATNRRHGHPYISCSNCGPRYSIITALPYDRDATTMADWVMCSDCEREYRDPADRRFHAQPIACHNCGPHYHLINNGSAVASDLLAIQAVAQLLRGGAIVAIKGLGGYHLACDAKNAMAVADLRARKFRREKPFAVMAKDLAAARGIVTLSREAESLLTSAARPIVLAPALVSLPDVAPDTAEIGVMLPYTPLHYLLFAAGAPDVIVMTSGNRSSEPIAYQESDAFERLSGIADAFLTGDRAIARRVDDSVVRVGALGPMILRRSRGYAPSPVVQIPLTRAVLALGADLKNAVTLVVDGHAHVSQHIGDLDHVAAYEAFKQTTRDLLAMYGLDWGDVVLAHDLHPQFLSSAYAADLPVAERCAVQHHRAHIASVLAERGCFDREVLGIAFDGSGYGDDASIWGGEFFVGSVIGGFQRVAHLRPAALPGGDAAARNPVQAAAGFLAQLHALPDLTAPPFCFPLRYQQARQLMYSGIRTFGTTSAGRLFDTVAALLGFAREITFEGQASMWLEHLAQSGQILELPRVAFRDNELDYRAALHSVIDARVAGARSNDVARGFHLALATGIADAATQLCEEHALDTVVLSGGVFQNELLLQDLKPQLERSGLRIWSNQLVPPNDGGISLGQAALLLQQSHAGLGC